MNYVTHTTHGFEIEEAEEEHLRHACALITEDCQDDKQRWRDAAAQIIATKTIRIATLEAQVARLTEPVSDEEMNLHSHKIYTEGGHDWLLAREDINALLAARKNAQEQP